MQVPSNPKTSSADPATMASFRQRCASALMHPVTLGALAVLLVNDLVLKALWPGAWVPGKLSDFAWMVFAPPVLAYVLSFATLANTKGQRAAFLTAYAGLPLLYVAFNTFAPVHDAILHVLGIFGGDGPRSPLDLTDSVVIPFAMAAAIWVWRRPPLEGHSLRIRFAVLAATAAALASVASSYGGHLGVVDVGRTASGALGANTDSGSSYESSDGGLTWTNAGQGWTSLENRGLSEIELKTPSGVLSPGDIRIGDDSVLSSEEVIYSFDYLQSLGNRWVQALEKREIESRVIATRPYNHTLFYDSRSGNLILAMGLQGVVVVAQNGATTPVAVGPYSPSDFSFGGKVRTFFAALLDRETAANIGPALLLALSLAAFVVAGSAAADCARMLLALAVAFSGMLAVIVGVYPHVSEKPSDPASGQYLLEILGLLLSGFGLFPFLVGPITALWVIVGLGFLMVVVGIVWAGTSGRQALAIIGMLLLILVGALVLFETGPLIANFVAVGLVGLAAFGLWAFRRRRHNDRHTGENPGMPLPGSNTSEGEAGS